MNPQCLSKIIKAISAHWICLCRLGTAGGAWGRKVEDFRYLGIRTQYGVGIVGWFEGSAIESLVDKNMRKKPSWAAHHRNITSFISKNPSRFLDSPRRYRRCPKDNVISTVKVREGCRRARETMVITDVCCLCKLSRKTCLCCKSSIGMLNGAVIRRFASCKFPLPESLEKAGYVT